MSLPVTLAVLGAGARGTGYAKYAEKYPDLLKIVAVADPIDLRRNTMGDAYDIPEDKRFISWDNNSLPQIYTILYNSTKN